MTDDPGIAAKVLLEGTIVGVVADVKRFGLASRVQDAETYRSVFQDEVFSDPYGNINLFVRTAGDPLKLASGVREHVWAINPNLPVVDVMTMEQRLAASVAPRRFQMLLFSLFAVVALLLAAVGVYGVISYSVSRRTHEIGIQIALGARPRNVLLRVLKQGMTLVVAGVSIGLVVALWATRLLKSLLFELSPTDPLTFTLIAVMLLGVAFIACYLPARRATRVDPMTALRHE